MGTLTRGVDQPALKRFYANMSVRSIRYAQVFARTETRARSGVENAG
jgi:hypothetical protein